MVPRVSRPGRSFTGAWAYYFHDKRDAAQIERGEGQHTAARVEWFHVENAAGIEDERAAIGLMIDTARQSKRCEKPVYAFSLGWHPEQRPERAEMIEAARAALKVLEMQDHQAVFVAHNDTAHRHVHVIVNRVHPQTLTAANNYRDQQKLSAWALEQERAQNRIYCKAREFRANAREMSKANTARTQEKSPQTQQRPPRTRYVDNTLAECWTRSDGGKSFLTALEAKGWKLARGDRKENVLMAVTPSGRAFAVLRELNKGLPQGQKITNAAFDRQTANLKRESLRAVQEVQREMEHHARSRSGERVKQRSALRQAWETQQKARQTGVAKAAFDRAHPHRPQQSPEGAASQAERDGMQVKQELEAWAQWQRGQRVRRHEQEASALWEKQQAESFTHRRALEKGYLPVLSTRLREIRAIEERQGTKGFKGWIERLRHRDDRERVSRLRREVEELDTQHEAKLTLLRQQQEAETKALRERHGRETQEQERRIEQAKQAGRVPEPANDRERETLRRVFRAYSQRQEEDRRRAERNRQEGHDRGRGGRSRSRDYD